MPAGLSKQDIIRIVNRYIGVSGGYLGDFSYRSHAEFYPEYCGLDFDPDDLEGTTRERFIHIITNATPPRQAKILRGLISRCPVNALGAPTTRTKSLEAELIGSDARDRAPSQ